MAIQQIEALLEERKDYMRENCPAYHLACVVHETLAAILGAWPKFGEVFRAYEKYRHIVELHRCEECYARNKQLSDLSILGIFTYKEGEFGQETLLARLPEDEAERAARNALDAVTEKVGGSLVSFWQRYREACIDRADFEAMYCCWFGCEAGAGPEDYKSLIRRKIEPNREYD